MEIWKDIKDYEGIYQVSNKGRVKRLKGCYCNEERILKPRTDCFGYLRILLSIEGKYRSFRIHRLVANAFIPNPHNYTFVNHKNEDKTDNRVENLEWCSFKYNINYGTRNKRVSNKMTNGKLSKPVIQFNLYGNIIKEYPSLSEINREFGYSMGNISACCNGKQKTAYGYIWRYKKAV